VVCPSAGITAIAVAGQPEIAEPEPDCHGERVARLDELQTQQDATNQYTVRMGREAQAEPEVGWQAEAPDEIEMELQ
jgi:hypothetical protein